MLEITSYSVEFIKDPFGILSGRRYEFLVDIDLDEEDELYSSNGIYIRAVYSEEEGGGRLIKHELIERVTDKLLDFELEEDEELELLAFCKEHYKEADE
ncbi:DUF6509 family protein [Paenibacillus glycanilyticus]|uniref:Pullulanase n=1 Tax=Paenibacillus glycanilyticus TaxID=126569 RepID=A0ABQ6NRQ4_9BACL|nr:DUF6509 family protein [Paenibacillus glycanilyticus]GMK46679.1 hypothetical protein PghCCS26_38080 [Paenibacillus glycanilyticus]